MATLVRETKDIEALLGALNRSAERLQTLWFSFLGLTLYFIITALTTTHCNLLLEEAQSLPIVNLKVPLLPFYVIAPIFYLVLHFYVLMMLLLLARSAAVFEEALQKALPKLAEREQFRMRTENSLFLQLLVGAQEERNGRNGQLLAAIALITLALAPVVTLLVMQFQFLPYHHLVITWLHRGVIAVDVVLILLLWRGYRTREGLILLKGPWGGWRGSPLNWRPRSPKAVFAIFAVIWLSLWEGRWAGEPLLDPTSGNQVRLLIAISVLSDRLSLPNETIVGEALLTEKQKEAASGGGDREVPTRDFRGRNFAYADLSSTDLRGSSFALDPKSEKLTILRGAKLIRAQMQGADLVEAHMQGADLSRAQMQGAHLGGTQMEGADLSGAQMQWAVLRGAKMQGADLTSAQMQGADLRGAQMQGADLRGAQMRGANLSETHVFRTITAKTETTDVWFHALELGKTWRTSQDVAVPISDANIDGWLATVKTSRKLDFGWGGITVRLNRLKGEPTDADKTDAAKWHALAATSKAADPDGRMRLAALAKLFGDLICESVADAPHIARTLSRSYIFRNASLARLADQLDTVRDRIKLGRSDPAKCPGVTGFTEADWKRLDAIKAARPE